MPLDVAQALVDTCKGPDLRSIIDRAPKLALPASSKGPGAASKSGMRSEGNSFDMPRCGSAPLAAKQLASRLLDATSDPADDTFSPHDNAAFEAQMSDLDSSPRPVEPSGAACPQHELCDGSLPCLRAKWSLCTRQATLDLNVHVQRRPRQDCCR